MEIEYTNERFLPEFDGDWTIEHTHRYLFAKEFARDKIILDIACGDGYGSSMLAESAKYVVGIDISFKTVVRGKKKYPSNNLSFLNGNATAIPLKDDSVDLIISFETIEHLSEHQAMFAELKRVLHPNGLLIISSPDKSVYSDIIGYHNEFHIKELYRKEFEDLLSYYFSNFTILGQRNIFGSIMGAEVDSNGFLSWRKNELESRTSGLIDAEYLIAIAGNTFLPSIPSSLVKSSIEESDRVKQLLSISDHRDTLLEHRDALAHELHASNERVQWYKDWEKEARGHIRALEAKNFDFHSKNIEFESKNLLLETKRAELEHKLLTIYNSKSWRITAPLRFVAGNIRKILRREKKNISTNNVLLHNVRTLERTHITNKNQEFFWPLNTCSLEKKIDIKNTIINLDNSIFPLGVFLHIYYTDIAQEMIEYLKNLPDKPHLHISTDTEEKKNILLHKFEDNDFSEYINIRVCPNRGWDIGPFLIEFGGVLPQYKLILRLHSKRSTQFFEEVGNNWRRMLFSSLAGSVDRVNGILHAFQQDPTLGMICPPVVAHNVNDIHFGGNYATMRNLLMPYGIHLQPDTEINFPVGSMFWCRPVVLYPWLAKRFSYSDFSFTSEHERDGSLAHAMERLFFYGCGITGHYWARIPELTDV